MLFFQESYGGQTGTIRSRKARPFLSIGKDGFAPISDDRSFWREKSKTMGGHANLSGEAMLSHSGFGELISEPISMRRLCGLITKVGQSKISSSPLRRDGDRKGTGSTRQHSTRAGKSISPLHFCHQQCCGDGTQQLQNGCPPIFVSRARLGGVHRKPPRVPTSLPLRCDPLVAQTLGHMRNICSQLSDL